MPRDGFPPLPASTGRRRRKSSSRSPLVLLLLGCACIFFITNLGMLYYFVVPALTQKPAPSGGAVIHELQARIAELESSKGGSSVGSIPCKGCDPEVSKRLNRRFNFFVLNLDRRTDKMKCVREQFAKFGIHVRRIVGVDARKMNVQSASLLPTSVKNYLKRSPGEIGHAGCLYGHVKFLLAAADESAGSCSVVDSTLRSDLAFRDPLTLVVRNNYEHPILVMWVDEMGLEKQMGNSIPPGGEASFDTHVMHAWRVRESTSRALLLQFLLEHSPSLSAPYVMNADGSAAAVYVFGCSDQPEKISILFEDDIVLHEDFAEKLLWSFDMLESKAPDWDMFTLNWYCNSGHWKECDKNKGSLPIATREWNDQDRQLYSYTSNLGQAAVVPVKYFMSGGSYAVSSRGAKKLIDTFPCDSARYTCSMAVDWHYSQLIDDSVVQVYGASPPFVLMPEMGSVQSLAIGAPPKRIMQTCGEYKSDTHFDAKGGSALKSDASRLETQVEQWKRNHATKHEDGVQSGPYVAFDRALTWAGAKQHCASHGMSLATIASEEENAAALDVVKQACGHVRSLENGWDLCSWIGLNDYQREGSHVWSGPRKSSFRNFLSGEPNNMGDEDGIALCWSFKGKWIDYQNTGSLPCLLCERAG